MSADSSARPRLRWTTALGLALVVGWLGILAAENPMSGTVHGDGYYTWLWTRSMLLDHDVDFARDYEVCGDPWALAHSPHADALNQWNPGPSLFWAPLFAFDLATGDPPLDGGLTPNESACVGRLAQRAVRGSFVAGVLTMLLAFAVTRRRFGDTAALFAAACVGIASPMTYYATMLLSYGHAASACTSGLVVYFWMRTRRDPSLSGWLLTGAATGLAMLTRPQNALLAILPMCLWIELAVHELREKRYRPLARHVGLGFAFVAMLLLFFSPQIWFWWDAYGELFFVPQGRQYMRWGAPRIAELLFASGSGLFPWSPVLFLAPVGWTALAFRRGTRGMGIALWLLFAVTAYVNASVTDWWGAIGFPGRRFDSMTVAFAIGIAAAVDRFVREPRIRQSGVPAVLATLTLLSAGAFNLATDLALARGARLELPMGSESVSVPFTEQIGRPVWRAVGDPLTWPASIPFALRYGVHPRVWRYASQPELFFHGWLTMERTAGLSTFDFVDVHAELLRGFAPTPTVLGDTRVRFLDRPCGRALVPISWPAIGALRFRVASPMDGTPRQLWLSLDDENLGSRWVSPGEQTLTIPVSQLHQGIVPLSMCTSGGRLAFRDMEILDRAPSPAEGEAEYLRAALARRRAWRAQRHPEPTDAPDAGAH
jgi:hypothetical protein